ncbi:putative Protein kinase domain containing protein [Blattamonas nauphoetae]|uniref:Protein kinase domain-containing protein n=1 Tax=Blattamonas nauphoetae TaxID=2049346 RepID=A0ABQ9XYD0_9EUKA|nr:putative Protein kinase domain containing protein [Blattamonas nauphoetae]
MHNDSSGSTAHGDVKMENILLFSGGHFKLCDLGAAESEDVSSTRSVMSQLYVSPERMESETGRATCSSDVWALGIVLHWLLFGEPPFKSKSLLKLGQEISSFRVSSIGSDCGGEERALLMRMLDPNPETRVTSCQLCSFGVFRCLVNTPSGVWRLKDADDKEVFDQVGKWKNIERKLEMEKNARKRAEEKNKQMEAELVGLREKLTKLETKTKEDSTKSRKQKQEHPKIPAMPVESRPGTVREENEVEHGETKGRRGLRQGTVIRSQIGAPAIELFDQNELTVSGNVFTKSQSSFSSLVSFEFGAEVARLSLTIRKGPNNFFAVGIIASSLSNEALTKYFPNLKGGAGWDLFPHWRYAEQNWKETNYGSACLEGREGQRVVLEADGREGKRTLKLSQDGETQPVFFTNIPVPFRFAVCICEKNNAFEIESAEVVSAPQMVGGRKSVKMDG